MQEQPLKFPDDRFNDPLWKRPIHPHLEYYGVVVYTCQCGRKYVINSQAYDHQDCKLRCPCGVYSPYYTENKQNGEYWMPLEEYKALLAKYIVDGKKPKVPSKYKKVVTISYRDEALNTMEALLALGYTREEIIPKLDMALAEGLLMEDELVKRILEL